MDKVSFSEIDNLKFLSSFLCSKEEDLVKLFDQKDTVHDTKFQKFNPKNKDGFVMLELPNESNFRFEKMYIPKKKNRSSYRIVYKVQDETLKNIHKIIQKNINEIYVPLKCVHGFVSDRNVATNAKVHLCKKVVLKLDIKDFFPSVKKQVVINCFTKLGCNTEIAEYLAHLLHYMVN